MDIKEIVDINDVELLNSFYFENMYESFGMSTKYNDLKIKNELLHILLIQAVSYLRGKDRYDLLKKYLTDDNIVFIELWKKFYKDATNNYKQVLNFTKKNFTSGEIKKKMKIILVNEDNLMHKIWRYDDVK